MNKSCCLRIGPGLDLAFSRFYKLRFLHLFIIRFKVIEFGTNRKPVCDFLLEINSN